MASLRKFKLACVQMAVGTNKLANVQRAVEHIRAAADRGAELVVLPECFNSPYGTQYFGEYAEAIPGDTTEALGKVAKERSVVLIGGSIPERHGDKLFNTLTVFGRTGDLLGKYRKMHLFDIDVPGKIKFIESETLSAGGSPVVIDSDLCKIGLGICYDCRFPELAGNYRSLGCDLVVYPGAFNMTTGPAHWELLARSIALNNQMYAAFCSPARDPQATYQAWGHSLVAGPWGDVLASCDDKEEIIYCDIDLDKCTEVREWIPIMKQKRPVEEKANAVVVRID